MKPQWLALLLIAAACSDPAEPIVLPADPPDPCEAPFACESPGVDLEIVSAALVSTESDPQTGLPIIQPRVGLALTLRNIGSEIAPQGYLQPRLLAAPRYTFYGTQLPYPSLDPGEEFSGTYFFPAPDITAFDMLDDRMRLEVAIWAEQDTVTANNSLITDYFHLAVPILRMTFEAPAVARVGEDVPLRITMRNYGKHASAPAQTMTACLYYDFSNCTPEYRTTAGNIALPAVPADGVVTFDHVLRIPKTAAWQDAAATYSLYLCDPVIEGGIGYYPNYGDLNCHINSVGIRIRPNYQLACTPPVAAPGMRVVLNSYNCGLRPEMSGRESDTHRNRFHIVALDAEAGMTYTLERSDTTALVRIYDADGRFIPDLDAAPERIRTGSDQRIYLVMYSTEETLAITATRAGES